jgi:penicillin-binding protein 1A
VALLLGGLLAAAGIAGGAAVLAYGSRCDLSALRPAQIGQNTFVYAADSSLLGVIPAERNRQVVPLDSISPWLVKATVAIEDRRFYEHGGIDAEGIARAVWRDVKAGSLVEGGSTITQQLVRNLYISNERTVERKLTEACLAVKLDGAWSKERILASYLNSVFYGNLAYGAEAAARTYFSRPARWLTLPQAALLAGLTQAPTTYDPLADPARAVARRNQVLTAMLGEGMITRAQYAYARRQKSPGLRRGRLYAQIREPYFFGYVRDQLVKEYGAETVRSGGLQVYTTIEPRLQRLARQAISGTLTRRTDPAAAIVSINPANGAIRAMTAIVPGRSNNQFNLLSQARRQPGSTFKTFVLTAAVERGLDPSSTFYVSAPFTYRPRPVGDCEHGWWCVKTYDSSYNGWTSVESATLRSDNSVFAQLTLDVGPERVASLARRLGVRTPLDVRGQFVPAMGLGSIAVSPLDMASAYATLAAGGIYTEPTAIRKVIVKGKPDDRWATSHRRTRVLSDGVASVVTRILQDNIRYGTGTRAALDRPVAGKTGTTDKHADAWFVGYTPGVATAVWMGYTRGEIPMENVHGISVSGGSFPAEIWRRFMDPALQGLPARDFPAPTRPVSFRSWERGPSALSYDPYYVPDYEPSAPEPEETVPSQPSGDNAPAPSTPKPSAPKPDATSSPSSPPGPPSSPGRIAEP